MRENINTSLEEENIHIVNLWEPLEFDIDEKYKYLKKGLIFSICSNLLYYGIAFPILKIVTKLVYDLKIEGKKNINNLKSGAVSVSNHVLVLDCAMVGIAYGGKKIYYTTREESFEIPFVRKLIKLLRAIPIPKSIKNKENFIEEVDNILREDNVVHFYPEASLEPYCNKLRNFKSGAFDFAIRNKVPVVPMVYQFREPKGIRKLLKKKQDVTLTILKPVKYEENNKNTKQKVEELKNKVFEEMKKVEFIKTKEI